MRWRQIRCRSFVTVQRIIYVWEDSLFAGIDIRSHFPYHILFDQYEEERLGGKSFGSTKSGIAPFYSDKYAKIGFQVSELFDEELLKRKSCPYCRDKECTLRAFIS